MKKFIIILFLTWIIPKLLLPQGLYINNEYNFKITFPENWSLNKGQKQTEIIKGTMNSNTLVSVNVVVDSIEYNINIKDVDIEIIKKNVENSYIQYFGDNSEILDYGNIEINYYDFDWFFSKATLTEGIIYKVYQVLTFHNKQVYVVTAMTPFSLFDENEIQLKTIIESFTFL